jgi:hypothetical protein
LDRRLITTFLTSVGVGPMSLGSGCQGTVLSPAQYNLVADFRLDVGGYRVCQMANNRREQL